MTRPYTPDEVKQAIFSIDGNRAQGQMALGAVTLKTHAWHIVGEEVTAAVLDLFVHGRMLKALNTTLITLITKNALS